MQRSRSFGSLRVGVAAAVSAATLMLATPSYAQETRQLVMSAEFDTRPGARLTIDVSNADVLLRNGGSDRVGFAVYLRAGNMERGRARFEAMNFRADGNADEVSLRADREHGIDWDWRDWGGFAITVEVTVPEEYDADVRTEDGDIAVQSLRGDVRLRSSDGDISAESLTGDVVIRTSDGDIGVRRIIGGQIEIGTSDGDVSLGELQAAGIVIDTSDGDISGDRLAAEGIEVRTSDGDIVVSAVAGPMDARTNDGSIHVGIEQLGETSLSSGEGNITIRAAEQLAADLDLRGDDLSMRSEVRFDGTLDRRVIRGSLNGGGPRLIARTREGSIVLRLRAPEQASGRSTRHRSPDQPAAEASNTSFAFLWSRSCASSTSRSASRRRSSSSAPLATRASHRDTRGRQASLH